MTLLPFIYSAGIPAVLWIVTTWIWNPGWADQLDDGESKKTWKRLNLRSGILAFFLSALTAALLLNSDLDTVSTVMGTTAVATIGFVFFQSAVTDWRLRFVDRGTVRVATWLALLTGIFYYVYQVNEGVIAGIEAGAWIIVFLVASALMYFPGFGASDARAIALAVAAALPVVGVAGIVFSMVFYMVSAVGFVIWVVAKYRVSSIAYVQHISIPAVPFLLVPFLLFIVLFSVDHAFDAGIMETLFSWIPQFADPDPSVETVIGSISD